MKAMAPHQIYYKRNSKGREQFARRVAQFDITIGRTWGVMTLTLQ